MRVGQRGTSPATYDSRRFPYQLVVGQRLHEADLHRVHDPAPYGNDDPPHGARMSAKEKRFPLEHQGARAELVSDRIVTRAQGKREDSRVLQGMGVRGRVACL